MKSESIDYHHDLDVLALHDMGLLAASTGSV